MGRGCRSIISLTVMSLSSRRNLPSRPHRPWLILDRLNHLLGAADPADEEEAQDLLRRVVPGRAVVQVVTHWPSAPVLTDPVHKHRVDACRLVLAIKRRAIACEGKITLRRLALPPALVGAADVLTRLAPADPALGELVNERPERFGWVRKAWQETGHARSVRLTRSARIGDGPCAS